MFRDYYHRLLDDGRRKFASQVLRAFGNHTMQISHREGNGPFEIHQAEADLIIVQTGEATLIVDGTISDGKTTAPNELRGSSKQGGERKKLYPATSLHSSQYCTPVADGQRQAVRLHRHEDLFALRGFLQHYRQEYSRGDLILDLDCAAEQREDTKSHGRA